MIARLNGSGGLAASSATHAHPLSTAALPRRADRPVPAVVAVVAGMVAGATVKAVDRLLDWQERARQRHMLMQLDERMLRDIGITRADAAREYDKTFWQR